jgi:hypothetical protein
VPSNEVVRSVRSRQPSTGYYHLFDEFAASCMPLGALRPSEALIERYVPTRDWEAAAYGSDREWDAAIEQTAHWAAEECAARGLSIGVVIFCHTSIPQDLSASIPARFQHLLGAKHCVPLALSQSDSVAAVLAMRLACAYLASDPDIRNVLIVGGERWTFPFFRCFGDVLCYWDGMAAAIVSSESGATGTFKLKAATVAAAPGGWNPFSSEPSFAHGEFVPAIAKTLSRVLRDAGLADPSSLVTAGPAWSPSIVRAVQELAGLPPSPPATARGFLGAADLLATLHEMKGHGEGCGDILAWTATLSGQVGICALSQSRSTRP